MDVVLGKYGLQTTLGQHAVVHMASGITVVPDSPIAVVLNGIGSQSSQDLSPIISSRVEPMVHLVKHHPLDLGWGR